MSDDENISLLTLSCDKYNKLWPIFTERFNKNWKTFRGEKSLLTNHRAGQLNGFSFVDIGEDVDWSQNLLHGLARLDTKYVFLMLEDTPINTPVDQDFFDQIFEFCVMNDADYVNTKALPAPRGQNMGVVSNIEKGSHYRASLCNAIWRKDYLSSLLVVGESPWDFEINASVRSNESSKFYGTRRPLVSFDHLLIRGKLTREAIRIEEIANSELMNNFSVMSRREAFLGKLMVVRNRLFTRFVKPQWQQKLRAMM